MNSINCNRSWNSELETFIGADGAHTSQSGVGDESTTGVWKKLFCQKTMLAADNIVQNELVAVQKMAGKKITKLIRASDVHIGLEILHLFICDLLGRGLFHWLIGF